MQHIHFSKIIITFLSIIFWGCGPSQKITSTWINKDYNKEKDYAKMYISAFVKDPHVRAHLEDEMGKAALEKGFKVERSLDYFPPTFKKSIPPMKDAMSEKMKELGCDIMFTINLIDKTSETRFIAGSSGLYGPYMGYGYHFRGFYTYWYPYIYDPGYYVTDKTYFMEGNIFDALTGTLIWSVQTETLNPSSIEHFSKELVKLIFEKAMEDLQIQVKK